MSIKLRNDWYYEKPWWPYRWWSLRTLFRSDCWSTALYPSYPTAMRTLLDSCLAVLTPWYRPRRMLLSTFMNSNGGKLLENDRKSATLRTRFKPYTAYYSLKCGLCKATMIRKEFIDESTGDSCNMFMEAISRFFMGAPEKKITAKETRTDLGACITMRQCEKALAKCVAASQDLGWWDEDDYASSGGEDDVKLSKEEDDHAGP